MKTLLAFLVFVCLLHPAQGQTWKNDRDHSRLGFTVTHMLTNDIIGAFDSFTVVVQAAKPDFSDAVFDLTAQVASINTKTALRDEHLRGENFFEVEKYPTLRFRSTGIRRVSKDKYKLTGNLTMHGITKPITVDFWYRGTLLNKNSKKWTAGIQVTTSLKRSDFNIGPKLPLDDVADKVMIKADGEFQKQD